jgi:DNA repair protein RadA/Sms
MVEEVATQTAHGRALLDVPAIPLMPVMPEADQAIGANSFCPRLTTGFAGVDSVLGGGLASGSIVLLAGDPGIGKSTLLLQIAQALSTQCRVSYVSGEESAQQVSLRAARLGIQSSNITISCKQDVSLIEQELIKGDAQVVIVDSIQSLLHPELAGSAGSINQVRESAAVLATVGKAQGKSVIIIGHVTKDGSIAGPRVLEHIVDVVLQFESDRLAQLRILRAGKNRFGSTDEIAIFSMNDKGLQEVESLGAIFLGSRQAAAAGKRAPSGTAVAVVAQGKRGLALEVQALVGTTVYTNPRRVATGMGSNRLLQILAVLEKKAGMDLSRHDVYVNIAGGFEFDEPGGDLAVAGAIATSYLDRSLDTGLVLIGEIGLTGEVRPVSGLEQRLKEAQKLGFTRAVVPAGNIPINVSLKGLEIVPVQYVCDALGEIAPASSMLPVVALPVN